MDQNAIRKKYEKPEVKKVRLESAEAVLAFCKSTVLTTAAGSSYICTKANKCKQRTSIGS